MANELYIQRGQTASWELDINIDATGGTWDVLENRAGKTAPTIAVTNAALGKAIMTFSPEQTKKMNKGKYPLRIRLSLSPTNALALPQLTVVVS